MLFCGSFTELYHTQVTIKAFGPIVFNFFFVHLWNNCKVYIYGNECLRQRFLINDLYVHCKLLTKICKIWYWNICARREFITSVLVKLKVRI